LKIAEPLKSFFCWFFYYDKDGRQGIFVTGFSATLWDIIGSRLGQPTASERPCLYRNEAPSGFRDATLEAGLEWILAITGLNFGDIDVDKAVMLRYAEPKPSPRAGQR
jgi:hypothetical protein